MSSQLTVFIFLSGVLFAAEPDSRPRYDRVPAKFEALLKQAYGPHYPRRSAQLALGRNFLQGKDGFPKDSLAATAWFYVAITRRVHHDYKCRFYPWSDDVATQWEIAAGRTYLRDHTKSLEAKRLKEELHDKVWGDCDTKSGRTVKKEGVE